MPIICKILFIQLEHALRAFNLNYGKTDTCTLKIIYNIH